MEYLAENLWIAWLLVAVFFLVVELSTTALISIWFVAAAVVVCLLSLFVDSILTQIVIFVLLSAVFMIVARKIYKKHMKSKVNEVDKAQELIGKSATVTESADKTGGRVIIGDIYWRAVTENDEKIQKGENVIIKSVRGTTLVISKF